MLPTNKKIKIIGLEQFSNYEWDFSFVIKYIFINFTKLLLNFILEF
jgi:hypothetical protein